MIQTSYDDYYWYWNYPFGAKLQPKNDDLYDAIIYYDELSITIFTNTRHISDDKH